jgi:hypothetical protein
MGTKDLTYVNTNQSIHSFPTTDQYAPKSCTKLTTHDFQNCGIDGVREIFTHVVPGGISYSKVGHDDYLNYGTL